MDGWYKRDFKDTCVLAVGAGHTTHLTDSKGPMLGEDNCDVCHATSFDLGDMVTAGVCDNCHSPDGAFDGVSDSVIGAGIQANWDNGVYESDGKTLKAGKEQWCAGCHDDGVANSKANDTGVDAPNVTGDNSTYGFYVTGHNINCLECHDADKSHIDHSHRTYQAGVTGYNASYRLKDIGSVPAMNIPRPLYPTNTLPISHPEDFALCFDCHNAEDVLTPSWSTVGETNFWNDDSGPANSHNIHLGLYTNHFDSDWDGTADSSESCIACHNVHGSPTKAMIRHGELISTPGTTDKLPALNFVYLVPSAGPTATATWAFSIPGAGTFDLYGWWTQYSNRASNAPYTTNYGAISQTIRVNQKVNGGQWNYIGTFTFAGATSGTVVLGDDADGYVMADAIGWDTNGDTNPDIIVDDLDAGFSTQGSGWLSSGADPNVYNGNEHYHAKQVPPSDPNATLAQSVGGFMNYAGANVSQNGVCTACHGAITYVRAPNLSPRVLNAKATPDRVANDGSGSTLITASVFDPDGDFGGNIVVDLSVIGGSSSQQMYDNGSNGDAVSGDGVYSYEHTVPNGTSDIATNIAIIATDGASNTGQASVMVIVFEPGVTYVDDTDTEFSVQGSGWNPGVDSRAYGGTEYSHASGSGSNTATWRPDLPQAGNYAVYAWWTTAGNRATDAPYTIHYDGGSQTIDVNQEINGQQWNYLGTFAFVAGTAGSVVLSDDANQYVIADAVKFKPVP